MLDGWKVMKKCKRIYLSLLYTMALARPVTYKIMSKSCDSGYIQKLIY